MAAKTLRSCQSLKGSHFLIILEHILTLSFVLRVKLMSETRSKETLQEKKKRTQ